MSQRAKCTHCHRPISREGNAWWCHDTGLHVDMMTCAPEDTHKPWGACTATPEDPS